MNYHDALASAQIGGAHPGGMELTKQIFTEFHIPFEHKVMDIGCGNGETSIFIAKKYGCTVFAVDHHPGMIRNLKVRLQKEMIPVTAIHGSSENLSFPNNSLDLVISESVLTFTNVDKSLAELNRILKHGSILLLIEMTSEKDWTENTLQEVKAFYGINKVLTEKDWIHALDLAGFKGITVLKSSTVNEEMASTIIKNNFPSIPPVLPLDSQKMLDQQNLLLVKYGDQIGYRVIVAKK